jgi:hypothetical protein
MWSSRQFSVVCVALLPALTLASENGGLYMCDDTKLSSENLCYFTASSTNTAGATGHNIDLGVGNVGFRKINDASGNQLSTSPKPWTQGDVLVASSAEQTGDALNYAKAFEIMAPLRDAMMYAPGTLTIDEAKWNLMTKALQDCQIKSEDTTATSPSGTEVIAYGTKSMLAVMSDPGGEDIHHYVLQFLEEGAIDLVCQMTSLTMDRCTAQRALGATSDCWEDGYTVATTDTTSPPSPPPPASSIVPATQSASHCGQLGWDQVSGFAACANSVFPGGYESVGIKKDCYNGRQMKGAATMCEKIGARLCFYSEAIGAIAAGTGCNHDNRWHWTGTACGTAGDGTEKYYLVKTKKAGKSKAKCKKATKSKAVRCCADAL